MPEPQTHNAFDDISLDDTPKIDMSFGTDTGNKTSGSGFSFGGWGSSWDTSHDTGTGATDIGDTALGNGGDSGIWSFGSKNKKKATNNVGFDFGNFETPEETPEPKATTAGDQDDFATGFATTGKKGKKNKKNALEDATISNETAGIDTAVTEPTAAEDTWGTWDTPGSKEEKKKKKNDPEPAANDIPPMPPPPPPPPPAPSEPPVNDTWSSFGTKSKKKGKKGAVEEPVVTVPEAETEVDMGWGSFGTKKDKKKGKKVIEEGEPKDDDIVAIIDDPGLATKTGWGTFGANKDTKKSKGGTSKDVMEDTHVISVPEMDPAVEDSFDAGWGSTTKKGKKHKKGTSTAVKEDPVAVVGSLAATEATNGVDDDWMNWGSEKKKDTGKKGKKGTADANKDGGLPPPPPLPPVPEVPEASSYDIWGSSKKDKMGKKGKTAEAEPAIIEVPEIPAPNDEVEEDWGSFGLSAKDKKKKEKEKQKEREKEEKEKKEMEELLKKEEEEEKERKEKEAKEKEKVKPGKKGKAGTTTAPAKNKDLLADSVPDSPPVVEEDTWGSIWGSSKKDSKKKTGKDSAFGVPPPVPTPPAQGLTPPPEDDLDDLLNDDWGSTVPSKSKGARDGKNLTQDDPKQSKTSSNDKAEGDKKKPEESAAKAARSFWGGMSSTATPAKAKTAKEKEKEKEREKEEKANEKAKKDLGPRTGP